MSELCIRCRRELRENAKFCTYCGAPVVRSENICSNPACSCNKDRFLYDPSEMFCAECGSPTTNGKGASELL